MAPARSSRRRRLAGALLILTAAAIAVVLLLRPDGGENALAGAEVTAKTSANCDVIVTGLEAVGPAVDAAAPGTSVCLADGSYGKLELDADKSGADVTVRAEHPGQATIAGAELSGTHLALAEFDAKGEISIEPGSRKISVLHNRISGGYFGVEAGPTTSTSISDTTIRGNKFVGPFGEDAIRLNRYHDSGDPDHYGVLIEGNEISNVRENGQHSDCLQSVWGGDNLYFRRNYLHDNRCQGFFINDQPEAVSNVVISNNLMLRNAAPCDPPNSGCGPPLIVQIFGPTKGIRLTRNTIWTSGNASPFAVREGPFGHIVIHNNVLYRAWSDWSGGFPHFTESDDVVCVWEGTLPRLSPTSKHDCHPHFRDPAHDNYRVPGNAGITWSPTDQHYGP